MKYYIRVNAAGTFWYKDPEMQVLHRDGGPAVEYSDGRKEWWLNGIQHLECGSIIGSNVIEWHVDGNYREDIPAFIAEDGTEWWWVNGNRPKDDGTPVSA